MSTKGYFSGKKEFGKKSNNNYQKSSGNQRGYEGKRSYGDKPAGERSYGDKKPYGERSYGDKKPYEKKQYGDKPYGERSYGDKKPYEKKQYGDKPYGERSYGDKKPYEKKQYGDKPYGERSYGDKKPYEKKQYGDKPYGERSYGDKKPYEKKQYGDKPYGERRYGDKKPYDARKNFERKPDQKEFDRPQDQGEQNELEQDELPYLIIGRNAVREAVKSKRSIDRILVSKEPDGSLREIMNLAKDEKLVVREVERRKLDELTLPFGHGGKPANHQGIVAYAAGVEYCEVKDILEAAKEKGEEPFVIVLDGVLDPHNLGSILRSADCAGAHGVVIGKRRCASVTSAAVKSSAGAVEHVKVAKVTNITSALEELKNAGLWIAGAEMTGKPMGEINLKGALALVIGGEGEGLSALVEKNCDHLVSIPMTGHIGSLNASVAAAVLMFEKRRQDGK